MPFIHRRDQAARVSRGKTQPNTNDGPTQLPDDVPSPSEVFESRAPRSEESKAWLKSRVKQKRSQRNAGAKVAKQSVEHFDGKRSWRERINIGLKAAVAGLAMLTGATVARADHTVTTTTTHVEQPAGNPLGIRLHQLNGKVIPQDHTKVARTPSHEIRLSTVADARFIPDLHLIQRTITDPSPRASIVDQTKASSVHDAAGFAALLKSEMEAHTAWLKPEKDAFLASLPEEDRSLYALLNVRGQRLGQFFDEMSKLLDSTSLRGAERDAALQALNFAKTDTIRGEKIEFDPSDTGSYWSYGSDAPFVKVYERLLESLPHGSPEAKALQSMVDYIFTHKYAKSGGVNEDDAETSMGLVAIDKDSRHVVSMTKDSDNGNQARYVTLTFTADDGAKRAVFRDGADHYFEGTREKLTEEQVSKLTEQAVGEVTFRRMKDGEELRKGFRYDWNLNGRLDAEKIDTGWWGHCDIRAIMEAAMADMAKSGGFKEFRTDTGETTEYTRAHQLEALASLLNVNDRYVKADGSKWYFGKYVFAGARHDDRPSTMIVSLDSGSELRLTLKLSKLSEKGDATKAVDLDKTFGFKIVDDNNETFRDNPDIIKIVDGDTSFIDASGRAIEGTLEGTTFDERGRAVPIRDAFTIDPNATAGERVLIGSELRSLRGREVQRSYYDPATKDVSLVQVKFVEEDGKWVAKEGAPRVIGKLDGVQLGRELTGGDDAADKLAVLEEAARFGKRFVTDSDIRDQVWNGAVNDVKIETEWRSPDGQWERIKVKLNARFGSGKEGTFLRKLDAQGKQIEVHEMKPAVDFFWISLPRVAPLIIMAPDNSVAVNEDFQRRGLLTDDATLEALRHLTDLVYLGFEAKDGKPLYTILHEGKRLVYQDEATWKADIARLKGE